MQGQKQEKKKMKMACGGYFTVEASLIMLIVFGCILLIVYLGIFQYDRCVMEQNMNLIVLRALSSYSMDNEARGDIVKENAEGLDVSRYLAWEKEELGYSIKKGKLYGEIAGKVKFPFQSLVPGNGNAFWEIHASAEGNVINPVSFVRKFMKLEKMEEE